MGEGQEGPVLDVQSARPHFSRQVSQPAVGAHRLASQPEAPHGSYAADSSFVRSRSARLFVARSTLRSCSQRVRCGVARSTSPLPDNGFEICAC